MCIDGGLAEGKVTGNTPLEKDKNRAWATGKAPPTPSTSAAAYMQKYLQERDPKNPLGFSVAPPPNAPDFTDGALKQRRAAQSLMLLSGRGRRQAFLGQGYGPSALGGIGEKE